MPRYKLIIEYDGTPFVGWQMQDNGRSVQGALDDGDRGVLRRAGRWCRAPAAPTPACTRSARSRMSISPRSWDADTVRDALNAHLRPHPVAVLSAEQVADDFDARFSAVQAALSLSHRQPPRRSRARPRPRLARAAAARCRGDARRRAAAGRQARLHHLPLDRMPGEVAGEDARPARRRARRRRDRTSTPSARSFLHNQVRSMVGSLVLVGEGKWSADDLAARARRARPRRLRPGGAAGRALSGAGGLLSRNSGRGSCR